MARPIKHGLDYFPFDIDFFYDEKVVCVAGEFGLKGEICLIHLLCAVYRNGYFVEWTKPLRYKLLRELPGVSGGLLGQIVESSVRWGFFDKDLFDSAHILTSRGIQRRYFEVGRRRISADASLPYLLIPACGSGTDNTSNTKPNATSPKEISPGLNTPAPDRQVGAPHLGKKPSKDILNDLLAPMSPESMERQLSALGLSRERFDEVALMVLAEWEDLGEKQRNLRHLFNHVRRKIASDATLRNIPLREKQKAYREARNAEQRQRDANADAIRSTGKTSWQLYCEARGLDPATTSANDL